MVRLFGGLLMAVAVAPLVASSGPTPYFHFQNISSSGDFEAGHKRGNPVHWIARHEHQQGTANRGQVRWYGDGSSGLRVWDLDHGQVEPDPEDQPHPERKGGTAGNEQEPHQGCLLHRLHGLHGRVQHSAQKHSVQRRAHGTLITRDCQGNPLEPPGVRISPGPPRPTQRPRAPPAPAAPFPGLPPPWRLPAEQTLPPPPPPPSDVYLHINKRGGQAGPGDWAGALDAPRGFEPTAEQDQEGQEDHLRGMKHADKQLMFGDGSYQAASSHAFKLQHGPLKVKGPLVVKGSQKAAASGAYKKQGVLKRPVMVKVAPMKGSMGLGSLGLGSMGLGSFLRPRPLGMAMPARPMPMVVYVRPMTSNRLPYAGPGPVAAAKPLSFKDWIASMWKGG